MGCGQSKELTVERIVEGLKEALAFACAKAIEITSAPDGFNTCDAIHIPMPKELAKVTDKIKILPGFDTQVAEFEETLNRAAEAAAGAAGDIFSAAVANMSVNAAKDILNGGDGAATKYFIRCARKALAETFAPIVQEKVNELNCVVIMDTIFDAFAKLPFCDRPEFDVGAYVLDGALNGLFHFVNVQENIIRHGPEGRQSDCLKEVFGSIDKK